MTNGPRDKTGDILKTHPKCMGAPQMSWDIIKAHPKCRRTQDTYTAVEPTYRMHPCHPPCGGAHKLSCGRALIHLGCVISQKPNAVDLAWAFVFGFDGLGILSL